MLYYFRKDKNATEMQETICAVYGKDAVTDRTCQKWFVRFRAGDVSLDDATQSGRPVELDSDQIKTLIENNQHDTTLNVGDILKISKTLKLLVKMKNVFYFIERTGLFGQHNITRSLYFLTLFTNFTHFWHPLIYFLYLLFSYVPHIRVSEITQHLPCSDLFP